MIRRYELPYPPSVNRHWRHVGNRVLISREGREYRKALRALVYDEREDLLDGTLAVRVDVFPPDRRRRDLDNVLKALLDALQHASVYYDDNQISRIEIERREVVPGGKVIVELEPYDEWRQLKGSVDDVRDV